ncbi:MAG: acetate--CoA ligase, partial [Cellvibrionaceae bacterium]|nr:acetate--CoA ligase [Cellvibrionaceae bacterium]
MSAKTYPVPDSYRQTALITEQRYQALYQRSIEDSEGFWAEQAQRLKWRKPFTEVKDVSFAKDDVHIRWFGDGQLNACENCLDRHLPERADQIALIWEADGEDDPGRSYSYAQLHAEVGKMANALKSQGVKKGDVVTIYLPMVPLITISMLACARIGAVHSVVFGGFSPEAIAGRIDDGKSRIVITADEGLRGGKHVPLKHNVDAALDHCQHSEVEKILVLRHTGGDVEWHDQRDVDLAELIASQSADCPAETMGAEDPLFILYTSGSTGKPKGVLHTTGGYLTYTSFTHETVFDYRDNETYWCMADIGWITGHSYAVYGPLANGATVVMYEGVPNYPDSGRMARLIEKHQISIVYTAPTAIRALMADGDIAVAGVDLSCIRILATAGEPINPEAWRWFHDKFGNAQVPILDTWWQTETGGMLITPFPGATALKPGSATRPFFGVQPALMDTDGNEIHGEGAGSLVIKDSWPGQMRTIY